MVYRWHLYDGLIYLDLPGFTWIYLGLPGFTWIYLGLPGFTWIFIWIYLDLPGFIWVPKHHITVECGVRTAYR